jgi:hypothetical protein
MSEMRNLAIRRFVRTKQPCVDSSAERNLPLQYHANSRSDQQSSVFFFGITAVSRILLAHSHEQFPIERQFPQQEVQSAPSHQTVFILQHRGHTSDDETDVDALMVIIGRDYHLAG